MACAALRSELAIVLVVLLVAGDTSGGRAFVGAVEMASGAQCCSMGAGEWKGGPTVVEESLFPG